MDRPAVAAQLSSPRWEKLGAIGAIAAIASVVVSGAALVGMFWIANDAKDHADHLAWADIEIEGVVRSASLMQVSTSGAVEPVPGAAERKATVMELVNLGGTTSSLIPNGENRKWAVFNAGTGEITRGGEIQIPPGERRYVIVETPGSIDGGITFRDIEGVTVGPFSEGRDSGGLSGAPAERLLTAALDGGVDGLPSQL